MTDAQAEVQIAQIAAIVIIGIMGWIVTHILRDESERERFRLQVQDSVRLGIMTALRKYQDWLTEVNGLIPMLRTRIQFNLLPSTEHERSAQFAEYHSTIFRESILEWAINLEDYEILFPETSDCRLDLLDIHNKISALLAEISRDYWNCIDARYGNLSAPAGIETSDRMKKEFLDKYKASESVILDQICLIYDFKKHLQNISLGNLFGRELTTRSTTETKGPHVIRERNGMLKIINKKVPEMNAYEKQGKE